MPGGSAVILCFGREYTNGTVFLSTKNGRILALASISTAAALISPAVGFHVPVGSLSPAGSFIMLPDVVNSILVGQFAATPM